MFSMLQKFWAHSSLYKLYDLVTGLVGSYRHYLSRRSLCQTEKVCESIYFLNVILIFFPMVFNRFNFMTPSFILFCVFISLFCHFVSLADKVLSSWFMQLWSKFCDFVCCHILEYVMVNITLVMLRVLRVLARIVLSVTLCYLFLCFQCLSRWLYKKLVFLLFYNGDIIPVSVFLYFFIFLDRVIYTHACLQILL